jgi:putative endonuclease
MHYLYVLRIKKTGRHYTGQAQDLAKRLEKHSLGKTKSMKNRGPFEVVYVEKCGSRAEAMKREKEIKRYKGGDAFKRLSSGFAKQKMNISEPAEVSRLRREGISS